MVPPKTDPKWINLINNLGSIPVSDLSARMMLSRVKMKLGFDDSEETKLKVISDMHDFFTKNQVALKADITKIFG